MNNYLKLFLANVLLVALTSIGANADPLYYVTLNSNNGQGNSDPEDFDIGSQFTVSSDITVTELGAWGGAGEVTVNNQATYPAVDTMPLTTTAYLWSSASTSTPLASVTIDHGADATLASSVSGEGWAFADLTTPVVLTPGLTYYITNDTYTAATDSPGLGYTRIPAVDLTVGSSIDLNTAGVYASDDDFPSNNAGSPSTYGGNFVYTVAAPEPSTWALALAGLMAVAFALRRRAAKA